MKRTPTMLESTEDHAFGLGKMIRFWAKAAPNRPAVIQSGMVVTYRALVDAMGSIGQRIADIGIEKGEPIALSLAHPSSTLAAAFALLELGFDVAPVNRTLYPHFRAAGIKNLIYDNQGQVLSGGRNIRFDRSWLPEHTASNPPAAAEARPRQAARAVGDTIFFTSGTTGLPKRITQSSTALEQLLRYPFTSASGTEERILIMPSLASTFGFNRACEVLYTGKTALFAPTADAAMSVIFTFRVDRVIASPAQTLALLDLKKQRPGYDVTSLQSVLIGGGKVSHDRLMEIRATLCRNCLSQYGSTEGGVVALAPFATIAAIPGAVGFILPWVTLEIVDGAGEVLPAGSEGMIRYRTPQLVCNLARSPEIPGVKGQWFYPGDLGSVSSDGLLCLADRISEVINRGGVKLSSTRIEEILQNLPGIREAAACPVVGSSGMEEVWIAVVGDGSQLDIERIKQHLQDHDEIKVRPDQVFILPELPRGELGKIQKHRLREIMLDRTAGA